MCFHFFFKAKTEVLECITSNNLHQLLPDTIVIEINKGSARFCGMEYYQQAQSKILISVHLQPS